MRPFALVLAVLTACGGAAETQPPVTIPQASASAPPPAVSGSIQQTPAPSAKRPTSLPGTAIRFEGGDGSSVAQAIIIRGARGESDGVAAEYQYLEMIYGPKGQGHDVRGQALMENNGRSFDRLDVELKDGRSLAVYFDITDYFGKF